MLKELNEVGGKIWTANESEEDLVYEECLQQSRGDTAGELTHCENPFLRIPWTLDEHAERSR